MRNFLSVLLFMPLLLQAQQQLLLNKPYHAPYQIKTIRERNGRLTLLPAKTKWLNIGGNYNLSTAANFANTLHHWESRQAGPSTYIYGLVMLYVFFSSLNCGMLKQLLC